METGETISLILDFSLSCEERVGLPAEVMAQAGVR